MEGDGDCDGVKTAKKQPQLVDDASMRMEPISEEEARLDFELKVVRKMRLAFSATLQLLEAARDDLAEKGRRLDRLTAASHLCRSALQEKKKQKADIAFERDNQLQEKANSNRASRRIE